MSNLNTELIAALLKNQSIEEVFRSHLETAINELLKIELTEFLGYEKHSVQGYGTGNSRNETTVSCGRTSAVLGSSEPYRLPVSAAKRPTGNCKRLEEGIPCQL